VTIVNPNAPGGFVDIVARGLAASMQRQLRQPVLVVNRPGANAAIGTIAVTSAAPDGYTLLLQSPALAAVPAIDEVFQRPPTYQLSQLVPIAQITADPAMLPKAGEVDGPAGADGIRKTSHGWRKILGRDKADREG
jgi:tripartite-type tricarboxylate transporter receptor subunit TctC